jgi:two-component system, NtrC family, sensor histidine kinase KinB
LAVCVSSQSANAKFLTVALASISILTALFHLPVLMDSLALPNAVLILGTSLLLYVLAVSTTTMPYVREWTGFARLSILIVWVLMGPGAASLVIVVGVLLSHFVIAWVQREREIPVPGIKSFEQIANHGISLLVTHLIFLLLGGATTSKLITEQVRYFAIVSTPPYYAILPTILAFAGGAAISLLIAYLASSAKRSEFLANIPRDIFPELSVLLFALGLPLVLVIFGEAAFLIMMGLVAGQNLRQLQISRTEYQLTQRIREMSTLNSLGHSISSQLSLPSVLDTIYRQLTALVYGTCFVVALYDDEQDSFDFRFVVQQGKHLEWPKQKLADGLIDYVVREKKSVMIARNAKRELLARGINSDSLEEAQYIAAPLLVAEKMVGVICMSHASNSQAFSTSDFELLETIASQASLAIRNAMLYERTVRLADNLSIINQSLQDVMFNLDRQDALRTACEIARNVTGAQKAAIFLLQPNRDNRMERVQALGFEDLAFVESLEYKPDLFQAGARIVRNVAETEFEDIRLQAIFGKFQASLQIPLRSGNTIVGNLAVYHDAPHLYEATERNLLEMLANQITAALDNADLLQALELYAAEQAQLVHLSRISGVSLDLERIIFDVCELLSQVMEMYRVEIGLYTIERGIVRLEAPDEDRLGLRGHELQLANFPELERLLLPDNISTLRAFYSDSDEDTHSEGLRELFHEYGDATLAMIPMRINQQIIGVILLGDAKHRLFNDNDYRLLEMATHQITAQIHNARVHTQTEEALVQRLEQLALIEEIAQQISQALDLELIIQNVLEAALQSTQADFAAIALLKPEKVDTFEVIWREVVGDKLLPNTITLQITQGIVGNVAQTGEMLLVGDNKSFGDYFPPPAVHKDFKSSLAVPLKKGEAVIGVLNLESRLPNFFTMEQASFIKSLAGHAAISIDNANLLEERESRITTLSLLRELSLETLSVIKPAEVAQEVLRTALVALNAQESMLYRYDVGSDTISWIDGFSSEHGHLNQSKVLLPETVVYDVAHRGSLELIPNTHQHDAYINYDKLAEVGHQSLIAIPIARRRNVREVLCIGFAEPRQFSHEDLNTVDLLAVQVAGHLENAALNEVISISNDRMRAILNSTRDGIVLLNLEGRVQEVNNAAVALSGLALADYLQEPLEEIVRLPQFVDSAWPKIVEAYGAAPESIHEQEYAISQPEGLVHLKLLVFDVTDENDETVGRLLVMRDITQEKVLREFRDKMQSYVLHDLRGPLSSIITSMYVAMNLAETVNDETLAELILPTLQVSLDSGNDLLHMVDTLRDLPLMKEMQIEPQLIELRDLAEKAYKSLSSNITEANIAVNFDIPDGAEVFVDENLIRRVIMNLMHNAFKFTPENGEILIRMDQEPEKEGYVRVLLADTGPGIPEIERERIFGQFVQIKGRKPRAGGKGMGLGLNFCKLAVEAHGGRIWVEPASPLTGACFAFTLPNTSNVKHD